MAEAVEEKVAEVKEAPAKKVQKKSQKKADKTENVIDIADFFTTTREKEGVWVPIELENGTFPLEFKILGPASDRYAKASKEYDEAHDIVLKTEDNALAIELERKAVCNFLNAVTVDFRPVNGVVPVCRGKELKYSEENMFRILYESIEIRSALYMMLMSSTTFQKH